MAQIIDGKALAAGIEERVRVQVAELPSPPRLVSLYVGVDAASAVYIRNQRRACERLGIRFDLNHLPAEIDEDVLIEHIQELNNEPDVTGLLLQRPLPRRLQQNRIQSKIHPDKDVEGLNPANIGAIVYGNPKLVPCTALAAIRCLLSTGRPLKGLDVVMIGHSEVVGKPIAFMMLNFFATATICHVATQDLAAKTRNADVLFSAVGKPGLIHGDMIKPDAVVIDIGISQVELQDEHGEPILDEAGKPRNRLTGDVDFESAVKVASHITPVPGGVGPVTVAMLLHNTVLAARQQAGLPAAPLFSDTSSTGPTL
jgi:methylenetetrahydrofolate dehydrogenase (NADP+)/methenyltetrahydrofolate cyclohydrolase